jgi:hypothetical protein
MHKDMIQKGDVSEYDYLDIQGCYGAQDFLLDIAEGQ